MSSATYVGRFAPSPTGSLHFGSLLTAVASYCEAKKHGGRWLVRIEDTDIPRIAPHSEEQILRCLDAFALHSDAEVIYQRQRLDIYEAVLQQLKQQNAIYACQCSRKQLNGLSVYPNTCRELGLDFHQQAIRLKVDNSIIQFNDELQGQQKSCLLDDLGDFILKRRDGIISYQLAVVVDDYLQGITHVMRGADLLDNTARQIWLGQLLSYPRLNYCHLPLAMNKNGQKLSKQNLAQTLDIQKVPQLLQQALCALNQPTVEIDTPETMLAQAVAQWNLSVIPPQMQLQGIYQ